MFSPTVRVRFRPSFFPYTEPSAEIDLSCWQCDGAGCAMCKMTGWIELGGCGMVHPAGFEAVGYDAEHYTGFAWGVGIERIAILRFGEDDVVIDFEVTANRPDCLSVSGFAREVATIYDRPITLPSTADGARIPTLVAPALDGASDQVQISIADPDLCPRYAAAV